MSNRLLSCKGVPKLAYHYDSLSSCEAVQTRLPVRVLLGPTMPHPVNYCVGDWVPHPSFRVALSFHNEDGHVIRRSANNRKQEIGEAAIGLGGASSFGDLGLCGFAEDVPRLGTQEAPY
ncbi:hypothetical protein SNOG_03569 [Parastagonospora nodorum SN15]|uniref:Uncharacterized protein n=1 Tax=Phaeosphaeria nodorum (strain SN15 / ATCC MYA-4574 / FGSC 10173) TaxID=321614 RepID=Q0UXE5_PHANO|nr:hypothetical protein SNOG_03569 [Parastagonospora nodorum SN15]EAT88774.1 hypothetical protein SNOG_03569 [Parastagonospora nodorum SN15]